MNYFQPEVLPESHNFFSATIGGSVDTLLLASYFHFALKFRVIFIFNVSDPSDISFILKGRYIE